MVQGIPIPLKKRKQSVEKKAYIYLVTVSEHAGSARSGVNTKQKHRYNKSFRSWRRQWVPWNVCKHCRALRTVCVERGRRCKKQAQNGRKNNLSNAFTVPHDCRAHKIGANIAHTHTQAFSYAWRTFILIFIRGKSGTCVYVSRVPSFIEQKRSTCPWCGLPTSSKVAYGSKKKHNVLV